MSSNSKTGQGLPPDVRMRGFASRTSVTAALRWIDSAAEQLDSESVPLTAATGRVLSAAIASRVDVPAFDRSMMDGYALQAAAVQGASPYHRLRLKVVGQSLPGRPFRGAVAWGEAVQIATGAPVPAGADAILPAELAEPCDFSSSPSDPAVATTARPAPGDHLPGAIWALGDVAQGKHLGLVGEDIHHGDPLLAAGRVLRPQDVGLVASIGRQSVDVVRRPRVQLVITGSELAPVGMPAERFQIYDANGPMLQALAERDGGEVLPWRLAGDDQAPLRSALAGPADVVLVSGGSSVGPEDEAPRVLAECGELSIHGVAMRPSSPSGMGRVAERLVFLLPGNPVSCLSAYDFFAGRAIRLLGGRSAQWPYRAVVLPLARKLVSELGRVDYCRVRVVDGVVEPLAVGGAAVLSSTTRADGFVIVPEASEGFPAGATVEVLLYDR